MRNILKRVTLLLLRAYKWAISPMIPPSCRYVPTCSEYAMEAVERYGALRGGFMALMRLLRCHPFVKGGFDPVVQESSGADLRHETHSHRAALLSCWESGASAMHLPNQFAPGIEQLKRNS